MPFPYYTEGPYGSTTGTHETAGTLSHTGAVTYLQMWADNDYIYGMKPSWGTINKMYGNTNGLQPQNLQLSSAGDYVQSMWYYVDTSGVLRGIKLRTFLGTVKAYGYLNGGTPPKAFGSNYSCWTDVETWNAVPAGGSAVTILGIEFYSTGSGSSARSLDMGVLALPALATLAHAGVVARSFRKVGKLRYELNVKAPSCDPPPGTDPAKVQLWYRTFRAQENCKEMFLVYLPSILIASTFGYVAFGKWAPRAVAALTLAGAYCRYKYLNAYIEDADKRGPHFRHAMWCMKPVFILAVVSAGYVAGKKLYCSWKGSCENGDENEEE